MVLEASTIAVADPSLLQVVEYRLGDESLSDAPVAT
jgi:hypothetical protein